MKIRAYAGPVLLQIARRLARGRGGRRDSGMFQMSSPGRPPYQMKADGKAGEITFYEAIGESSDGSGTTAKSFQKDLKALGDVSLLRIFINSPGGSVFEGTAIFNILDRHPARKEVMIDGIAASIASVIAMVGDEIKIAANGMMEIHDPWGIVIGSAAEMRKTAETLDKIRSTILGVYVRRSGADEEKLSAMMSEDTWFTAEEAVEIGLADSIVEPVALAALAKHDLSWFRHVPEQLAKAKEGGAPPAESESAESPHPPHSAVTAANARAAKIRAERAKAQTRPRREAPPFL
jgi:ATP-dependent Clp protease protease subunit